jgi:hypothetical protein
MVGLALSVWGWMTVALRQRQIREAVSGVGNPNGLCLVNVLVAIADKQPSTWARLLILRMIP